MYEIDELKVKCEKYEISLNELEKIPPKLEIKEIPVEVIKYVDKIQEVEVPVEIIKEVVKPVEDLNRIN